MTGERDLGPQPIGGLLAKHALVPHDLVEASDEQLTHKMVARAVKGRRLTPRAMWKVLNALNAASGERYELDDLFDYAPELEPRAPRESAVRATSQGRYVCPNCSEEIVVPIGVDDRGRYVEDCPVCCSPCVLDVSVDEDGNVSIDAQAE